MKDIWKRLRGLPLQTHRSISLIFLFAGIVSGLLSCGFPEDSATSMFLCALFGILAVIGIIWHIAFVKCPYCGHRFDLRSPALHFCPNCGEKTEL